MVESEIKVLRKKLEDQILSNESYSKIYQTSSEIDKLIVEFYKQIDLKIT
ncbi:MAG: Spo0E family sporulation regulatory protein-aspartic acid phosphatase [Clostridia bacterium]